MKKIICGQSVAEVEQEFYSNVRSENDLASYTSGTEVGDDDYFFGEIKESGDFTIKHHVADGRSSRVEFGRLYVSGKIKEEGDGSRLEYEFRHHAMPLEMLCAVLVVAALIFLMTIMRDVIEGLILLGVMVVVFALVFIAPIERARFKRLILKMIKR